MNTCYPQLHLFCLFLENESSSDYSSDSEVSRLPDVSGKNAHKWEDTARADENGLLFKPDCNDLCFINKAECNHLKHQVKLNKVGEYVAFSLMWYHHGYYIV
jgi:hypothetical protein